MTSPSDRRRLLEIARAAIGAHLGIQATEPIDALGDRCGGGAFVSLHGRQGLRGCIGHIESDEPVSRLVARCAVAAATRDPRFPAVTRPELPFLHIEVSILGPLEPVRVLGDVAVGRHGVVVEKGVYRGLLLPQVAVEWDWDAETFVSQACLKAGLAADAWKLEATLWRFEAEVFAESRGRT
jgi:AmmeMemoRadiSam system protein A